MVENFSRVIVLLDVDVVDVIIAGTPISSLG